MTADESTEVEPDDTTPESTVSGASVASTDRQVDDASTTDTALEETARAELLAEENRRLRAEYARAQQSRYRRTAYGLFAVGLLAVLGGVLFPNAREVLFALGGTGLFGGVLTLYLTPGQFVAADVGERVYAALAENESAIATELGLSDQRVYVPGEGTTANLYIPQHAGEDPPEDQDGPIVVTEPGRGLLLAATGSALFEELERALSGTLAEEPPLLATQLADSLVEQFELASAVDPETDPAEGRATFAVSDSAFGDLDRLDHPVVSVLAAGFAIALDRPVTVEVAPAKERADWLVTCRWDSEQADSEQ